MLLSETGAVYKLTTVTGDDGSGKLLVRGKQDYYQGMDIGTEYSLYYLKSDRWELHEDPFITFAKDVLERGKRTNGKNISTRS